jgi:hypothetical protein
MLQEAGLSLPRPVPRIAPPQRVAPSNWKIWKRIPAWVYFFVVTLSVLITLLEGYPWLSIEKDELLNPLDPYSQMFYVINGGYVPTTEMEVTCAPDFMTSRAIGVTGGGFRWAGTDIPYLGHGDKATLPCFRFPASVRDYGEPLN